MKHALRAWSYRAFHFLDQFKDEAPACCGTCKPCIAATATGVTGLLLSAVRRGDLRRPRDAA